MYDIFIEAGQSNAEGFGHGPSSDTYTPDHRILYLNGSHPLAEDYDPSAPYVLEVADERPAPQLGTDDKLSDLSLTFARDYVDAGLLQPGRKLLIVRTAVGGTGFMFNQWEMDAPLYLRMLSMTDHAMNLHPDCRLKGVIWHQGEHEAFEGNTPSRYHGQLLDLLNSVKARYNCPKLPFICGGFCDEWVQKFLVPCNAIMQVLQDVAAEMGGAFIPTQDLLSNNQKTGDGDDIHFCRESLHILGHRYFTAYQTIRK